MPPRRSLPCCLILLAQVLEAMVAGSAVGPCAMSASKAVALMGVPCAKSGPAATIASVAAVDLSRVLIDMLSSWVVFGAG